MNRSLVLAAALAALGGAAATAGADEYYRALQAEIGTNDTPRFISTDFLLDRSNTVGRLTNGILSREVLARDDQLLGLHIGMTMRQVFEMWGKPTAIWIPCDLRPCLHYGENCVVSFDPTNQVVDEVTIRKPLELRMERTTPLEDFDKCVRLVGEPDERRITPDPFSNEGLHSIPAPGRSLRAPYFSCDATYFGSTAKKVLSYNVGELVCVSLQRNPPLKKEWK